MKDSTDKRSLTATSAKLSRWPQISAVAYSMSTTNCSVQKLQQYCIKSCTMQLSCEVTFATMFPWCDNTNIRVTSCGWQNEIQWNCFINARNGTLKLQKLAYFASWRSGILWYSMRWSHRKSQNWLIFVYCWNSSAPGRFKKKISKYFFKLICWIGILRNLSEIALKRMPPNLRW